MTSQTERVYLGFSFTRHNEGGAKCNALTQIMRDDPVGRELADLVREQYTRYVAFHSERYDSEADLLTLWTMLTHVQQAFDTTPYIYVTAPTPEAGKSRIIDVGYQLVARPHVLVDPTAASLFKLIDSESPTLFIDEADELHSNKALRAVLNAGHSRGGVVPRGPGKQVLLYQVFSPKLIAGIKGKRLPLQGATLSRCIEVPMRTRIIDKEPIEDFVKPDVERACAPLRTSLETWASENVAALGELRPPLPVSMGDRQRDSWRPLMAIAVHIGADWTGRVRMAIEQLRPARRPDEGTQVVADMYSVWQALDEKVQGGKAPYGTGLADDMQSVDRAWTQVLCDTHAQLDDRQLDRPLTPKTLAQWLTSFDIKPLPAGFRASGSATQRKRGYERRAFADAFERYLRVGSMSQSTETSDKTS